MSCTIDHLSRDQELRVLKGFRDLKGLAVPAETRGSLVRVDLHWPTQELHLVWKRNGREEVLRFALQAQDGPRNGHMREYFEVCSETPAARPLMPVRRPSPPVVIPELRPEVVESPHAYDAAVARVWALAARQRFEEADAQVSIILDWPDPHGGTLCRLAHSLETIAAAHLGDKRTTVYAWLRTRALNLWYAWGSQATSGGEGAARSGSIRAAESRLPEPG